MKMKKYKPLIIIALITLLAGCYYDNREELYPQVGSDCDTSNVTYSGTIYPILNSYCLGCHGSGYASFGGNIRLDNYNDIKTVADDGRLFGSVMRLPDFSPMPKNAAGLDVCKQDQIKVWIKLGAVNN